MTRRDCIAFAKLIRDIKNNSGSAGWEYLQYKIGMIFQDDNPLFDAEAFKGAIREEQ